MTSIPIQTIHYNYSRDDAIVKMLDRVVRPKSTICLTNPTTRYIGISSNPMAPYYPTSITSTYVDPIYNIKKTYPTLDNDKEIQRTISKYFKHKFFEKYLRDEMYDLLGFLVVDEDGKVNLIKSMNDYKGKIEPTMSDEKKIQEYSDNYVGTKLIYKILKSFVRKNNVKWYHLQNHSVEKKVKKYLHKKIKSLMEELVIKKS